MIFGVPVDEFPSLLSGPDEILVRRMEKADLSPLAKLGPGTFFYAARLMGKSGYSNLERRLLEQAIIHEKGIALRRSAEILIERASAGTGAADKETILKAVERLRIDKLSTYATSLAAIDALMALDRPRDALNAITALRNGYADDAVRDEARVALIEARGERKLGSKRWYSIVRDIIAMPNAPSAILLDALAMAMDPSVPFPFKADEPVLFQIRVAVIDKDYGQAVLLVKKVTQSGMTLLQRAFLSDIGKAFLYAREYKAGETALEIIEKSMGSRNDGEGTEIRFISSFYQGRLAAAAGNPREAVKHFDQALKDARNPADKDSVVWYLIDTRFRISSKEGIAAISEFSAAWSNPGTFSDIIDTAIADTIRKTDWAGFKLLFQAAAGNSTPRIKARLSYLAARLAELGFLKDSVPAPLYGKARSPEADPYYRIMATYRLGENPFEIPAAQGNEKPEGEAQEEEAERFLAGLNAYGMPELIWPEARALMESLSDDAIRRLSALVKNADNYPDSHADSMRLIGTLFSRPAWHATREDYDAWWPQPFKSESSTALSRFPVPIQLFYALMRSESFFRPGVVSSAGAVGLTQLMPATAAENARKLSIADYDIKNPVDNILIGASHFSWLLRSSGGKVLHAVFAYNAGSGRLKQWEKDFPALPDDLFLESLPFVETRQYGRNVVAAAAAYAALSGLDVQQELQTIFNE